MATEDEKKPDEGEGPPSETVLEKGQDPEQAVLAEQAIIAYAHWVLSQVQPQLETAIESFGAWILSQGDAKMFDNQGFFSQVGSRYVSEALDVFGGAKSPIAQALRPMIEGASDAAARDEMDAGLFVNELQRALRDACWYLRDNVQAILSGQWDSLRDLAYEGSTEFIPVLHGFGLPRVEWSGTDLTAKLVGEGEKFRKTVPQEKEQAEEKAEGEPQQKQEQEGDMQKDQQEFAEQEGQKKAG